MLQRIPLPPGAPEALLLLVILVAIASVIMLVRRRRRFARIEADVELPDLKTEQRTLITLRRIFRDPAQGVWLAEGTSGKTGKRRLVLCLTDYEAKRKHYDESVGKVTDFSLFGMATLAAGGAEAMRDQIRDADKITGDAMRLIPAGQYANDYVVIGRIASRREDAVNGIPVMLYRVQVTAADDLTLMLELACDPDVTPALSENSMTHGAARLYGYLPG